MANFNKIMLMGNLTRDPEMSYLPSNTPVVEFGLAVNRRYRRQDGEQGEETLFVDCRSFGRTAELLNQYLRKGRPVFIEGRLQLDRWQDRDGNQRSKHRVFVENFQFIDSRGGGDQPDGGGSYDSSSNAGSRSSAPPPGDPAAGDDDIPF
jgi:single-strand DNA-binding protein